MQSGFCFEPSFNLLHVNQHLFCRQEGSFWVHDASGTAAAMHESCQESSQCFNCAFIARLATRLIHITMGVVINPGHVVPTTAQELRFHSTALREDNWHNVRLCGDMQELRKQALQGRSDSLKSCTWRFWQQRAARSIAPRGSL